MTEWSRFEARSRSAWRGLAQLAAWLAPIAILFRAQAFERFAPGSALGPSILAGLALVIVVGFFVGPLRRSDNVRPMFLPALLPVLGGAALALTAGSAPKGDTFDSQWSALSSDLLLRHDLVIDGFHGGVLVLCAALTLVAWKERPLPESRTLAVGFGLRASVLLLALVIAGLRGVDASHALLLLPLLLGIVALADLGGQRGWDIALVFGVALAAAVLALCDVDTNHRLNTPSETARHLLRDLARYLPALLLAFGLVFARRADPGQVARALPLGLAPPLVAAALVFALAAQLHDWARLPYDHWLRGLPHGIELVNGPSASSLKQRVDRVLLIGEHSLWRGSAGFGSPTDLDSPASCDKLVERLELSREAPLVFAADRRVPFARLDCLLGAVTRFVRARARTLDAGAVKALCTAHEMRIYAEPGDLGQSAVPLKISLVGEGCPAAGVAVLGADWGHDSKRGTLPGGLRDASAESRCPEVPLGLSRDVPDDVAHGLLRCAPFAPSVVVDEKALPPAVAPATFERLYVNSAADAELIRSCFPAPVAWPRRRYEDVVVVKPWPKGDAEVWHVSTGVENEAVDHCVRRAVRASAIARDGAQVAVVGNTVEAQTFAPAIKSEGWYPRLVDEKLPAIRGCFERVLRAKPALDGSLKVTLDIDARRRIIAVRSKQPKELDPVAYCTAPLLQGQQVDVTPPATAPLSLSFAIEMRWAAKE